MSAPTQTFSEALMHARNVAYVLKHSVGESQALIVSLNSGILDEALKELERAHQAELGKAGGQPAHPSDHGTGANFVPMQINPTSLVCGSFASDEEWLAANRAAKASLATDKTP